jgi:hypothetical protein
MRRVEDRTIDRLVTPVNKSYADSAASAKPFEALFG